MIRTSSRPSRSRKGLAIAIGAVAAATGAGVVIWAVRRQRRALPGPQPSPQLPSAGDGGAGSPERRPVLEIDGLKVYQYGSQLTWTDGDMSIDYDGAPNAYAPAGFGAPLDRLANAGAPGKWWGIVTDERGQPLVQGPGEPYPGYYISTTSLTWPGKTRTEKYVDSTSISFVALPSVFKDLGARLGDLVLVEAPLTGRRRWAIWADVGPSKKLGEGSIKLARELGIEASSSRRRGITFTLFLRSGDGRPHPEDEIQRRGDALQSERVA